MLHLQTDTRYHWRTAPQHVTTSPVPFQNRPVYALEWEKEEASLSTAPIQYTYSYQQKYHFPKLLNVLKNIRNV